MAQRIREIKDDQLAQFEVDCMDLSMMLSRVMGQHADMHRSEWLGGDQKANNSEEAPERCRLAMSKLQQARELILEADHEAAMFRATNGS